ncbi:DUF2206 domain-containing protein [archaeon]|nr:DUF2206 domain-containing protein [archaeon]
MNKMKILGNQMDITINKIFYSMLTFMILMDILIISNLNVFYFGTILSFLFIIIIPGLLIMLALKIRGVGFWEYILYIVGLSISFIMLAGLTINWILPWLNITDKPLATWPILICFNLFLIVLWIIAKKRTRDIKSFKFRPRRLDILNTVMFTVPILFPALAVLGALLLNNDGSNILSMTMLAGIAIYVFAVIFFREKLNPNIYPWAILMISISLLLMFSLRSWNISGFDIHEEYHVFQLTKNTLHWSPSNLPGHAYNTCLSITILPTILSWFLMINDQFLFKIFFQIILSFVPVGVYLIANRYIEKKWAFLASFFFMSQWTFINEMPALIRENIAILFFTLVILIFFNKDNINPSIKKAFFLIFGISVIFSHYSTSYLMNVTFILALLFLITVSFYKRFLKKERTKKEQNHKIIKFGTILILILFLSTFVWNIQLTESSGGLVKLVKEVVYDTKNILSYEAMAGESQKILLKIIDKNQETTKNFKNFISDTENDYFYKKISREDYQRYTSNLITREYKEPINKSFWKISAKTLSLITIASFLFLILGLISMLFSKKIDIEYKMLSMVLMFMLFLVLLLPTASSYYNPIRLYQQILIMVSIAEIIGIITFFKIIKVKPKALVIVGFFIFYFLFYSGFMQELTGGNSLTADSYALNSNSDYYYFYYSHNSEVDSAIWLSQNRDSSMIFADEVASLRLYSFGGMRGFKFDVIPQTIEKKSYVYLDVRNKFKEEAYKRYLSKYGFRYNFPTDFLNENKNLIYSNDESDIFK